MPLSTLSEPARSRDYPSPHDWVIDGALTIALGVLTCFPHALVLWMGMPTPTRYGNPLLVFVGAVLFTLPLMLRRHHPLVMVGLVTLAGLFQVAVSSLPTLTVVLVPLCVYSVARWVPGKRARWVVIAGMIGSVLGPARWLFTWNPFSTPLVGEFLLAAVMCAGSVLTPYSVGRRSRENDAYEQYELLRAREHYEMLLQQQQQRARMAEVNARNDIARELHDVVAHSLSVIVVQAEGGKALAAKKPEAAADVLGTIAETGREALTDMRRIVGVLRSDPGHPAAEFLPAPRLHDIPDLVAKSGPWARLTISGTEPAVGTSVGLTVYRIVQEALTNVLKHAGDGASAWVRIEYRPREIDVEIRDDGIGADSATDDAGNGLRGMAERVGAMGGELTAVPGHQGGFVVHARVPVEPASEGSPRAADQT